LSFENKDINKLSKIKEPTKLNKTFQSSRTVNKKYSEDTLSQRDIEICQKKIDDEVSTNDSKFILTKQNNFLTINKLGNMKSQSEFVETSFSKDKTRTKPLEIEVVNESTTRCSFYTDEKNRIFNKVEKVNSYWLKISLLIPNVFRMARFIDEEPDSLFEFQDLSRKELMVQSNGHKNKLGGYDNRSLNSVHLEEDRLFVKNEKYNFKRVKTTGSISDNIN